MPRPTFTQWRTTSSTANSLPADQIMERIVAALASFTIRTAPDGTTF
jgi:hypothetical protein